VLGETHGIAETANAILSLVRRLGIRSLGLEWSFDEVGAVVDDVVVTGASTSMRSGRFPPAAISSLSAVASPQVTSP